MFGLLEVNTSVSYAVLWGGLGLACGIAIAGLGYAWRIRGVLALIARASGVAPQSSLRLHDLLTLMRLRQGEYSYKPSVAEDVQNGVALKQASAISAEIKESGSQPVEIDELLRRLDEIRIRCKADAAFLAYSVDVHSLRSLLTLQQPLLRTELERYVGPHLISGAELDWGFCDSLLNQRIFGNFAGLGFRYSMLIKTNSPLGPAVVWLGFAERNSPTEQALQLSRRLVEELRVWWEAKCEISQYQARAQLAEQSVERRADDLAHISHDMKSPLHNIQAILHVLKLESPNPEREELFSVALSNCEDLGNRIEDVLDLTRHRAGRLCANRAAFNVRELVERVVHSFTHQASAKGLGLELKVGKDLFVSADRKQIERVVANLVGNAIKYTEQGTVSIELQHSESKVSISVRDTGPGLSVQQQQELFKPFTRFDTQGKSGTGLGLALSKILVELNDGSVSVASQPQKGCVFTITLPEIAPVSYVEIKGISEGRGRRVLVVDDDAPTVQSTVKLLERAGLVAYGAVTIMQAENILNYSQIDVIVCDTHMPDGGCEALIARMKQRGWTQFVITMSGDSRVREAAGNRLMLEKPVDPNSLLQAISSADLSGVHSNMEMR